MRTLDVAVIAEAIARLCLEANYRLPQDIYDALVQSVAKEESPLGQSILRQVVQNADIAREEEQPLCQDTGLAVVFMEIGQDVHFTGGSLEEAVNAGVAKGYKEGYLRKSVVAEPLFNRANTRDNTPAILHLKLVPGDKVKITLAPKGIGSENMSAVKMLKPSDGVDGVKRFVVETVRTAGPNPCPPVVVGVGVGGTMEMAALLAKRALIRPITVRHPHPDYALLEEELLALINDTGIGPQGLGGRVTALGVNVEYYPTHIGGLPVAVNIGCHATRHAHVEL